MGSNDVARRALVAGVVDPKADGQALARLNPAQSENTNKVAQSLERIRYHF